MGAHLLYGGIFGAALATVTSPVTVKKGIGLGIGLWVVMEVIVLPFLGWGLFGTAITPAIAVATLILHLIYGTILGWGSIATSRSVPVRGLRPRSDQPSEWRPRRSTSVIQGRAR